METKIKVEDIAKFEGALQQAKAELEIATLNIELEGAKEKLRVFQKEIINEETRGDHIESVLRNNKTREKLDELLLNTYLPAGRKEEYRQKLVCAALTGLISNLKSEMGSGYSSKPYEWMAQRAIKMADQVLLKESQTSFDREVTAMTIDEPDPNTPEAFAEINVPVDESETVDVSYADGWMHIGYAISPIATGSAVYLNAKNGHLIAAELLKNHIQANR